VLDAFEHAFITVTEMSAGAAGDWSNWVTPFLTLDGFVQAWVSDVHYNRWQNVRDPLEYQIAGRDHLHLPLKSNAPPPSVPWTEIDTSANPGRCVLRKGYVEAVAAVMWLGEHFWARVGSLRKGFLGAAEWLRVSEPLKGIVQIQVSDHCFVSEDTAGVQEKLRTLLYD
jgi:hypothetical protein